MRHRLKESSLWPMIAESERSGSAEPIHSKNAVREYAKRFGTNSSLFYAVEKGYFSPAGNNEIMQSTHSTLNRFGGSAIKSFNMQSRWQGIQPRSGSSNSWNLFLKDNKGKYSGKGWQQRAVQDYRKLNSGN